MHCRDGIVSWIKKKIGPGIQNIITVEEAEKVLNSESTLVVGFLDSLVVNFQFLIFFINLLVLFPQCS